MLQYEGKRVRGPNGEEGIIQGGKIVVVAPAQPSAPPPLRLLQPAPPKEPTPQNPEQQQGTVLNNQGQILQNEVTANRPVYERFGAIDKIRDGIRQDKRILQYETALPIFASALTSPNSAEADTLLVNAIAKIGDPITGVQQREGDAYQGAAPAYEQVKARLLKEFGSDGAGNFTPEGRKRMKEAMRNRMSALSDAYDAARDYWRIQIKTGGIPDTDPEAILGPHFGGPFQQAEADFLRRRVRRPEAGGGFSEQGPDPRRGGPTGNEAQFFDDPRPPNQEFMQDWQARNQRDAATFNEAYLDPNKSYEQLLALSRQIVGPEAEKPEWAATLRKAVQARDAGKPTPFTPGPVSNPLLDISDARGGPQLDDKHISNFGPVGEAIEFLGSERGDAAIRGAADTASVGLADPIAAGLDTLFGEDSFGENLWRQRGISEYDQANHPVERFGGQMAGALALPTRIPQVGLAAGRTALRGGAGRAEALVAAQRATTRRLAGEGAAYGGAYGFNTAQGDLGDRLQGGAVNALIGGGLGAGLGKLGGAILGRSPLPVAERNALAPAAAEQAEAAQAANALGIDMPRFVAGGQTAQNWGRRLEQSPLGRRPISEGVDTMIDQSRAARDRIASNVGNVGTPEAAAEVARRGAVRYNKASRANVRGLYKRAEAQAEGVDVTPQTTMQTLAGLIREEAAVPGGTPVLPILQHYAQAFEGGGPISIQGARQMRTTLRSRLRTEGNLTSSNADRITQIVMRGVGEDIESALRNAGRRGAIPAYQEADRAHAERLTTADDILAPFIGKDADKWGSDVAKAIASDAKGNGERLSQFLGTLHPEDANTVRASLINQLGRAKSGSQDAAGEAFSLDEFLTNWDNIRGARERIFDASTRRDLNRLAIVAQRAKATNRTRGHSNTGADVWAVASTMIPGSVGIGGGVAGSPTMMAAGFLAAATAGLAQHGGARLLASPGFARRLAQTPTSPRAAARFWSSPWVAQMARSNPGIASELTGFQQSILKAANDNAPRAGTVAASPDERPNNRQ